MLRKVKMSKKISNQDIIECLAFMKAKRRIQLVRAAKHLRKVYKLSEGLKSNEELLDDAVKELEV